MVFLRLSYHSSNSLKILKNPCPERARLSDQINRNQKQKEHTSPKHSLGQKKRGANVFCDENCSVHKTAEMRFGKKCHRGSIVSSYSLELWYDINEIRYRSIFCVCMERIEN